VASEYIIKNTNMVTLPNPRSGNGNRYQYWFTSGTQVPGVGTVQDGCGSGPITLTEVYVQEPSGSLSAGAVAPDTNGWRTCDSVWDSSAAWLSFPRSPQILGVVRNGSPPAGDFVPVGSAGVGYVSPGYK
jgi:hypothetical protein